VPLRRRQHRRGCNRPPRRRRDLQLGRLRRRLDRLLFPAEVDGAAEWHCPAGARGCGVSGSPRLGRRWQCWQVRHARRRYLATALRSPSNRTSCSEPRHQADRDESGIRGCQRRPAAHGHRTRLHRGRCHVGLRVRVSGKDRLGRQAEAHRAGSQRARVVPLDASDPNRVRAVPAFSSEALGDEVFVLLLPVAIAFASVQ
jgi:hypothetical protein